MGSAPIATKVKTSKKGSKVIENNQKRSKSRENQQIGDQQLNAMTAADDSIPAANVPKTTATNFTEKTGDLSKPEFSVKSVDKVNKEQSPPTTVVQPEKKKKKRKTNKKKDLRKKKKKKKKKKS